MVLITYNQMETVNTWARYSDLYFRSSYRTH